MFAVMRGPQSSLRNCVTCLRYPRIHVFVGVSKAWMAGTSPAMTIQEVADGRASAAPELFLYGLPTCQAVRLQRVSGNHRMVARICGGPYA